MGQAARSALEAGFHFIVPVWGEQYTRLFAELCLPTLIAPGNVPSLPFPKRHVFAIYTTPDDRRTIEAAPAFRRLASHIEVEFHAVRARVDLIANPYDLQSDCYRRGIRRADAADRASVFLTPDMILADGSLQGLARIASTSARAVLGVGIRLDKALMRDHLLANYRSGDAVAIAPRDLVRAALDRLHPIAKAHFAEAEAGGIGLSNLYWRVGGEGLLARCFHLHPFLVYPRVKNAPFSRSIDGDYVEAACPDPADTYVITDSDEFSAWELSGPDRQIPTMARPLKAADVSAWVDAHVTPRHRTLVKCPIRIHSGIRTVPAWRRSESDSAADVTQLLSVAPPQPARSAAGPSHPTGGLHFLTVLRDAADARRFTGFALPSALGLGNIPRLPRYPASRYTIAVPATCAALIESAPAVAELREHIAVDLRMFEDHEARDPGFASTCRKEALRQATHDDGLAIFIGPNEVVSGGGLSSVYRLCRSGIRALVAPPIALRAELAELYLDERKAEGLLTVTSEELVGLALADARLTSASELATDGPDVVDPGTLLWPVEGEGLLVHALALDLVAVHPRCPPSSMESFEDVLLGSGVRENEIGLFNDSGPFTRCHLASQAAPALAVPRGQRAAWAAAHTTPLQRALLRCGVRFRAKPLDGVRWKSVEAAAAAGVKQLLRDIEACGPAWGAA